ncbi:MAG: glycosyltransferase family 4 protein [Candidatus Helarchaeota archaeon]
MKKVCIITSIYPPDIGGPAIYSFKLKKSLENLGFDVLILTYSNRIIKNKYEQKIIRINRNIPSPLRQLLMLYAAIRKIPKYTIIYAQDPISAGIPAVLVGKLFFRKKIIFKIVGDSAWETARRNRWMMDDIDSFQINKYSIRIQLLKYLQRILCILSDKIIVPSYYLKKLIINWGITGKKIKVIYNSLDIDDLKLENPIKININKRDNEILLLSVGRLVNWKRFDIIIKTLKLLDKKFKLIIVGEGPEYKNLKKLSKTLGVSDRILFLGKLKHDELLYLYEKIDILILLSEYEGYSHVLIEALLKKKNIIASKIGGNPEIIKNYKNGILIQNDPNELRKAILDIINKRFNLIPNFGKQWNWNDLLKETIRVFINVLNRK